MKLSETHMDAVFPAVMFSHLALYSHVRRLPARLACRHTVRWLLFPSGTGLMRSGMSSGSDSVGQPLRKHLKGPAGSRRRWAVDLWTLSCVLGLTEAPGTWLATLSHHSEVSAWLCSSEALPALRGRWPSQHVQINRAWEAASLASRPTAVREPRPGHMVPKPCF